MIAFLFQTNITRKTVQVLNSLYTHNLVVLPPAASSRSMENLICLTDLYWGTPTLCQRSHGLLWKLEPSSPPQGDQFSPPLSHGTQSKHVKTASSYLAVIRTTLPPENQQNEELWFLSLPGCDEVASPPSLAIVVGELDNWISGLIKHPGPYNISHSSSSRNHLPCQELRKFWLKQRERSVQVMWHVFKYSAHEMHQQATSNMFENTSFLEKDRMYEQINRNSQTKKIQRTK